MEIIKLSAVLLVGVAIGACVMPVWTGWGNPNLSHYGILFHYHNSAEFADRYFKVIRDRKGPVLIGDVGYYECEIAARTDKSRQCVLHGMGGKKEPEDEHFNKWKAEFVASMKRWAS